jgi:hypothetical protein
MQMTYVLLSVLAILAIVLFSWHREGFGFSDIGTGLKTGVNATADIGKNVGTEVADKTVPTGKKVGTEVAGFFRGNDSAPAESAEAIDVSENEQQPGSTFEADREGLDSCLTKARDACKGTRGRKRDSCIGKKKIVCVETQALLESIREETSVENMNNAGKVLQKCNQDATKNKGIFTACKGTKGRKRMKCVIPLRKKCFEDKYMDKYTKKYGDTPLANGTKIDDAAFKPLLMTASGVF